MSKRDYKIYLMCLKNSNLYKIGISTNPNKRLKQLQTGSPQDILIVSVFESKHPFKTEKILHNTLHSKKAPEDFEYNFEYLKGEWFSLSAEDVIGFSDSCKKIEDTIEKLKLAGNPFV
jgi:hypothetical protein